MRYLIFLSYTNRIMFEELPVPLIINALTLSFAVYLICLVVDTISRYHWLITEVLILLITILLNISYLCGATLLDPYMINYNIPDHEQIVWTLPLALIYFTFIASLYLILNPTPRE